MRRSRVFASLAVSAAASAASLTFAAPALADYSDGGTSNASVSDTTVPPGGSVTGSDRGNDPGEQVDGYVHSARVFVGSTVANSNGVATLTFTVPKSLPAGEHTLELVGETSGHVGTASFRVTSSGSTGASGGSTSSGSGLPFTGGSDVWQMTVIGGGLVLLGGAALFAARRRRAGLTA